MNASHQNRTVTILLKAVALVLAVWGSQALANDHAGRASLDLERALNESLSTSFSKQLLSVDVSACVVKLEYFLNNRKCDSGLERGSVLFRNYIDLSVVSSDTSLFMFFPVKEADHIVIVPYSVDELPGIWELYNWASAAIDGGTMTEDELSRETVKRLSDLGITSRTEYHQCDGRLITELPYSRGAVITVSADPSELIQDIIEYKLNYC